MKILIVNTNPTKREGITNVVFNLLDNIAYSNLQFGYVSINTPENYFIQRLNELNCKLYILPRNYRNFFLYFSHLSKIAKDYDAVHVHGNSATLAIELFAAKIGGVKYRIAHSHNTSCKMVVADKILRPLFYTLCNGKLACGKDAGKWLYGNRPFQIIRNGIDTFRFKFNDTNREKIRKILGWQDKIVIGHIGNFVEAKNHNFIFEVLKSCLRKNENVRLACVGGGRLMNNAQHNIREMGLTERVHITGSVNNPEDYMSAMDVILMPSIHEGLPLTLVEEQANGLSCLVSDAITTEADLTGRLHFFSLSESAENWSDKLLDLVENLNSDRTGVSCQSISSIKEKGYDITTEAQKLCNFYKNFIRITNKKNTIK